MDFNSKADRPDVVPNQWLVMPKGGVTPAQMISDISALIQVENHGKIINNDIGFGIALIECDATFAAKISQLKSVAVIEPNGRVYLQNKRPPNNYGLG